MFQIKDFASIVAAEINHARAVTTKITDFQPGSAARTIMEAPAVEVEELYLQMLLGLREAIPVATFQSFGFDRLPPALAHGYVSISRTPAPSEPIVIALGTVFQAPDGRNYTSTEEVTWPSGQTIVRVPVAAETVGSVGNIAQGVISLSEPFPAPFVVSNSAIETGRDLETDEEREARFAEFVRALSRGTVTACLYAVGMSRVLDDDGNTYEYVTRTGIAEDAGIVSIYAYSSLGIPSDDLLADGQLRIDGSRDELTGEITPGYRAAGVRVDVLAMTERTVALSIQVQMFPGHELTNTTRQALGDIFGSAIRSVQSGTTLYLGDLSEMLLAVTGVRGIVPITSENFVCDVDEVLVPGTFTITAL